QHAGQVLLAQLPIPERLPLGEMIRLPLHGLGASRPLGLEQPLRPLDLSRRKVGLQLRPHRPRRLERTPTRRLGLNHEDAELGRRVVVGRDRRRELPLTHGAIEPRGASATERRGGKIEQRRIWIERASRAPTEEQLRLRDVTGPLAISETRLTALLRATITRDWGVGQPAVVVLDERECRIRIDVANDTEYRVARVIVGAIERRDIVVRERAQLLRVADTPAANAVRVE